MTPEKVESANVPDFDAAVITRKLDRSVGQMREFVGYSKRQRRRLIPIRPLLAAQILKLQNFTIDWQADSAEMKVRGFENIWQFITHLYPIDDHCNFINNPTDMQRFITSRDRWRVTGQAFNAFRKRFLTDYREDPLLMVPRLSGSNRTEVITFFKDYPVNETQTALDLFRLRIRANTKGHLRTKFAMEEAIGGIDAKHRLASDLERFIHDEMNKEHQAMLSFGNESVAENCEPSDG